MPELPEVEAARRAIEEHCIGKKIKRSLIADDPKVIDGISRSDFESSLLGKTIVAAHRKGKNMWLQLDSPPFPSFQFGMAGAIYIKGVAVTKYKRWLDSVNHRDDFRSAVSDTDEWPSKYSKLIIELDDGLELSFTDKRRFAKVRLLKNPASVPPISELGPDALFEPMTIDEFIDSLHKKKIGIKALLLDQSFISGIGNWIADEVLYQARIHPMQIVSSLSKESCMALHKCIKEVIRYAVEVDADCSHFPSEWLFHFRWGKRPGRCNGKKIEFITAGGRTSAYVPELQKLSGDQAAKAPPSKPKKQMVKGSNDSEDDDSGNEEEENLAKNVKSKGRRSTTGNGPKMPPAKRKSSRSNKDDNGDEDPASEEDENAAKNAKSKGRKRTTGNGPKVPPAKTKSTRSIKDDDDDDDPASEEDEYAAKNAKSKARKSTIGTGPKIPPAKRKSSQINKEDNSDDYDNDDDEGDENKKTRTAKNPPAETKSKKASKKKMR